MEVSHSCPSLSLAALDASPLDLFDDIALPPACPAVPCDSLTANETPLDSDLGLAQAPQLSGVLPSAQHALEGGTDPGALHWGWAGGWEAPCARGAQGILEDWGTP